MVVSFEKWPQITPVGRKWGFDESPSCIRHCYATFVVSAFGCALVAWPTSNIISDVWFSFSLSGQACPYTRLYIPGFQFVPRRAKFPAPVNWHLIVLRVQKLFSCRVQSVYVNCYFWRVQLPQFHVQRFAVTECRSYLCDWYRSLVVAQITGHFSPRTSRPRAEQPARNNPHGTQPTDVPSRRHRKAWDVQVTEKLFIQQYILNMPT